VIATEKEIMNIEKKVQQLVAEKIAEIDRPDLFLVEAKMHSNGKLIILVDGDNGIGIAECAQISRYVGFKLEEENTIETAYNLEVSSPGIDFPLSSQRQYNKNIGRDLAIKMADGTKKEGKLIVVNETNLTIEEKVKQKGKKAEVIESVIPIEQITETKVLISFK
jgi:ribosome maturation factor RimP